MSLKYQIIYVDPSGRKPRWIPPASALGNDQIPWRGKLKRDYEAVYEDGERRMQLGSLFSPQPNQQDQLPWRRIPRFSETIFEDGLRVVSSGFLFSAAAVTARQQQLPMMGVGS